MEIFAKLDIHLQTKIMVEYLGKFRIVDGMLKPTYILPKILDKFNEKYNNIPKPVIQYQEWYEIADTDMGGVVMNTQNMKHIAYHLYVKRECTIYLPIRICINKYRDDNDYSDTKSYVLRYDEERVYNDNTDDDIHSITRAQTNYLIAGHNELHLRLRKQREHAYIDSNEYYIVWDIWENGDDDLEADADAFAEFEQELHYDDYEEIDD